MSLLSRVKDIGISALTLTRLYGKTWDLLDSQSRITIIFMSNKEIHCLINGKSTIGRYDFLPDSRTLIISFGGQDGVSNHVKFVDENALIMKDEANRKDLCFCNRGSRIAPKTMAEAYKFYFAKHIEYIQRNNEENKRCSFADMTNDVDKVVEGLDDEDKIHLVDTLRDFLPGFNTQYVYYLGYYCKTHDPNFDAEKVSQSVGAYFVQMAKSDTLDYYIKMTGDNITKYRLIRR